MPIPLLFMILICSSYCHAIFAVVNGGLATGTFSSLTLSKTRYGAAKCAFRLDPFASFDNLSLSSCVNECRHRSSKCVGINHYDNGVCLMYDTNPKLFAILPGCRHYYSVSIDLIVWYCNDNSVHFTHAGNSINKYTDDMLSLSLSYQ